MPALDIASRRFHHRVLIAAVLGLFVVGAMIPPVALAADGDEIDDVPVPIEEMEPYFGQDRTTGKFIPTDPPAGDRPLVVLLHGYSMRIGAIVDRIPLIAAAEANGWYIIVPSGLIDSQYRPYWSATRTCCDRDLRQNDDIGYLRSVIVDAMQRYPIDRDRVVVVGLSNGAFMAYQLACHSSDLIVGIVSLAGVEALDPAECTPDEPVSIFDIHGTRDRAVFFNGGSVGVVPEVIAPYPSAAETVRRWVERNECPTSDATLLPTSSGSAGRWANCRDHTSVRYLWIPEGHNLDVDDEMVEQIVSFIGEQHRPPGLLR